MLTQIILPYSTPIPALIGLAFRDLAYDRYVRRGCCGGRLEARLIEEQPVVRAFASRLRRASVNALRQCWSCTQAFWTTTEAAWKLEQSDLYMEVSAFRLGPTRKCSIVH